MTSSPAFRPSVLTLEGRSLPSASIYTIPLLNQEQASYVAQAQQAVNPIVFFGDSITYNWGTGDRTAPGTSVFAKDFAALGAANFGIYGDTTANLIERVQGGDFAGKPKVAVVMIGFNDLLHGETSLQAATGVAGVVQSIEAASPRTTILLLGVLPSDQAAMNPKIQQLDALISVLGNHPGVIYENPGAQFLGTNDAAQPDLLIDGVHPDLAGYNIIANAIDGTVVKLLSEAEYTADRPAPTASSNPVPTAPTVSSAPTVSAEATTEPAVVIPNVTSTDASTGLIPLLTTTKSKTNETGLMNVTAN